MRAGDHDIANSAGQSLPQMAPRMNFFKVAGFKPVLVNQYHGQRIAHGQHGGGAGGGRKTHGAGLPGHADINDNITGFSQC